MLEGSYVTEFETPCAGQAVCGIVDVEEQWLREKHVVAAARIRPTQLVTLQWSGDLRAQEVRLYDQTGRPVETISFKGIQNPLFSVAHLPSGPVLCHVANGGRRHRYPKIDGGQRSVSDPR